MGVVILHQSGLIYEDDFTGTDLNENWSLFPNDPSRFSLTENPGYLRLKHGDSPTYLFFNALSEVEQFVLDVKNEYNPLEDGDLGGIIVFGNDTDNIALEEYYDSALGTANTYPWLRLVRDYNTYSAYYSDDGRSWHLIGVQEFDNQSPLIGLYVKGTSGQPVDIDYVRISTSTGITIENLAGGVRVDMYDSTGNLVQTKVCRTGDSKVVFDGSKLPQPFTCSFVVTTSDAVFRSDELLQVRCGDVYKFEPSPNLFFIDSDGNQVPLYENLEKFLGYVNAGTVGYADYQMVVKNELQSGTFSSIFITTAPYKGTAQGPNLVQLALDDGGIPGTFSSNISYPSLRPGEAFSFWVRVFRQTGELVMSNEIFFGLNVSSSINY